LCADVVWFFFRANATSPELHLRRKGRSRCAPYDSWLHVASNRSGGRHKVVLTANVRATRQKDQAWTHFMK
jgi:hypothetical protein